MALFQISSPIDALREYLSQMDIEMLDLILENKQTYCKLEKAVFLDKLDSVFDTFKAAGDTKLEIFRGECSNCFKRCRGYTLLGNTSAQYLDILIKEEQGEIKDIFQCSEMVTYKDCEKGKQLNIEIPLEAVFETESEEDILILNHHCNQALEELFLFRNLSIDVKCIELWLDRHQELYEDCINYMVHEPNELFIKLYNQIHKLFDIYLEKDKIVSELLQLQNIILDVKHEEGDLISWLLRNEERGQSKVGKISTVLKGKEVCDGKILLDLEQELFVSESDFKVFLVYESFFQKYYQQKLKEYSVFSDSELREIAPNTDAYLQARSLRYQIEQRTKGNFK